MISRKTAEHYVWGNDCDGWHLVKQAGISIIHECMLPNTSEVRHFHQKSWQSFFVISGIATLGIDGQQEILQPQEGVEVPSQPPSHGDRVMVEMEATE